MNLAARIRLDAGWAMAPGQAGAAAPDESTWSAIEGPMPVAAALAASGRWSLDGPARDFDRECWWYRCRFDRPSGALEADAWTLGLDGLATIAQAWLNGQPLLESRNMFRAHALPVAGLKAQGNELLIRFDPLSDALAQRKPRPRWRAPMIVQQQLRWWRTTLLGRTPGWSPPAAVVGPWRDVWLSRQDAVQPLSVQLLPSFRNGRAELAVQCVFAANSPADRVRLTLGASRQELALDLQRLDDGSKAWQGVLHAQGIEPWWPHTHGQPVLHAVTLQWQAGGKTKSAVLDPVGFRSIEADTTDGGFGLRVNGQPVFARGACWVPLDTLRLHAEPARLREVLTRLRAAGLNMVRVGGTMVYESEAFYALCDELGILVWQELMFANMDYPADDAGFAAEVDAELASQLPAWRARACVAVVCGNSEGEQQAAMWGAARELWQPALFHERIAGAVASELPNAVYWPSSAHGGAFPFQANTGTTSYYGVGAYRRGIEDARHSGLRFATECLAFAQVPPESTLGRLRVLNGELPLRTHSPLWKARAPRDLGAGWDFDDVRDHYVQALFGEDPQALRMSDPARHLMLGRAAAAEALTAAFSQWRAADSACRGALVWFLRDLWAGAGWGYLDDLAQPKAVFHALAHVCQPLHLGVTDDGLNGLTLHLANESAQAHGGRLSVTLLREGEWPAAQGQRACELPARSCQAIAVTDLLEGFFDLSWAYRFGPPPADVLVARWQGAAGVAERVHFIDAPGQRLQRRDLGLAAQARVLAEDRVEVSVTTRAAARGVHIEAEGWQGDDDFFHLAPGHSRTLQFTLVPGAARRPWRSAVVMAINARAPVIVQVTT